MNKKKNIGCSLLILLAILSISGVYYFKKEKKKDNKIKSNKSLAIIINSSGTETSSDSIPIGSYILNKEKTYCENNGKVISYDNEKGSVSFSFIGSDKCHLYFDYNDTTSPVFKNVTYLNNTFNATLYDDSKVVGYQITNSFNEPTSYIDVTDNKLSLTLQDNKNYYIWIKDASNNVKYYYQNTSTSKTSLKNYIVNRYTNQNEIKERTNFKEVYQDKNDSLFKTTESTDNKTVYYYAGDTQNNWVKFGNYTNDWYGCQNADDSRYYSSIKCTSDQNELIHIPINSDIYWRIVRTTEDDGIKLLYAGTSPGDLNNIIADNIIYNPYNVYLTNQEYVIANGYGGSGEQPNSKAAYYGFAFPNENASIYINAYKVNDEYQLLPNKILNIWYNNSLKNTLIEKYNTSFCNEVELNNGVDYLAKYRIELNSSSIPTLTCSDEGIIQSYIGLISADELVFAGGSRQNTLNIKTYFYINSKSENYKNSWWTMTPAETDGIEHYVYFVQQASTRGMIEYYGTNQALGIRPVLYLASCANYSSGDGSPDSPYEIDLSSCS